MVGETGLGQGGEVAGPAAIPIFSFNDAGLAIQRWAVEEGLPTETVFSLAQTSDGFLWIASQNGLVRFNGYEFKVFYAADLPGLESDSVTKLWVDARHRLWIDQKAGKLVCRERGHFKPVGEALGIPNILSRQLAEDREGNIWILSDQDGRLFRSREGQFELVGRHAPPKLPILNCTSLAADTAGRLWGIWGFDRSLFQLTQEGFQREPILAPDGNPAANLGDLFRMPDGSLALAAPHGVYECDGSKWNLQHPFARPLTAGIRPRKTCVDREGNFWIGTFSHGLFVLTSKGQLQQVPLPEQASESIIRDLLMDAEGNVWIAARRGLYRIHPTAFRIPAAAAPLAGYRIVALAQDEALGMWFITARGKALYLRDKASALEEPLLPHAVQYVASAPNGPVWLAGNSQVCEARVGEVKFLGEIKSPDGSTIAIRNLLGTAAGELWLATQGGIYRWDGRQFIREYDANTSALAQDGQGRIYGARADGGLVRLESGEWRELLSGDQRTRRFTLGFCVDENNTVWMAGDGPVLSRWREGQWSEFAPDVPFLPRKAMAIALDPRGGLWLTTINQGALRLDRSSLEGWLGDSRIQVQSSWFDHTDGLPTAACSYRTAICQTREGNIWIGTAKGAAVIDVAPWEKQQKNLLPPKVNVEAILIDDREGMLPDPAENPANGSTSAIVLRPDNVRIEFRYAAIHLKAPEKNRYRYRLEGFDVDWVEAGSRRAAFYTHLPPGSYRFGVIAANGYGLWNEQGISVSLTVQPAWWQRTFVHVLWWLCVGTVGWLIYRARIRTMQRRQAIQQEFSRQVIRSQEDERKRIAGELHDSLGQNLLVAKNQLFLVKDAVKDGPTQSRLGCVAESVNAALEEARTISHQLRPFQLERLGLAKAMRAMIREVSDSTRIPIEARIDAVEGLLPVDAEVMVYRLLQEALSNVVKHADASRVEITVERQEHRIRMGVRDDGRGFDLAAMLGKGSTKRGLGLTGFEERVQLLGGKFHCQSAPGQGTTLTFEVPIPENKAGGSKN